MANQSPLINQLATRERSLDFTALGLWLPNPDTILKSQGKDITTYRDMRTDALVGGCIRRRKSAVKALEWGLDRDKAASRVSKSVQAMLDDFDLERIIGQMLDATLYGYQPMEISWQKVGALIVPVDVQAKPPEWFCFDADSQLRFKTRAAPLLGELLPERKFLLPRQDATYQNPYGFADLSMCFWPLVFKKGGMKFWLGFAEKFGSAFSVGKLPRSASNEERAALLDSLEALIQNGVATIPDDGSIELVEMAGKSASADLYERLVLHSRGEIAIALLGQNQTTEASANKASAGAGLEVTKDLRDGDAEIVAAAMNQLIRWTCELNWGATDAPVWSLWDQESQDKLQAARDKSNFDAGARYSNAYFERAYGYQAGDLLPEGAAQPAVAPQARAVAFAEATPAGAGIDPVQAETDALVQHGQSAWGVMLEQIEALVTSAPDLATLQQTLTQAYGGLDSEQLVKLMAAALALAELKGMESAQ
jgi:phage gp29-like protein